MSGKEELQSEVREREARIHELINKFVLTDEMIKLQREIAILRVACGTMDGHTFENGVCKWCGSKEDEEE